MNTWILDTAIARLLSTNAVVLTEPPNSQIVGYSEVTAQNPVWQGQLLAVLLKSALIGAFPLA